MIKNRFKVLLQDEDGQILVLFALLLVVMLASVGLVVDVGYFYVEKQRMQNSVDASALGGAQVIHETQNNVDKIAKDIAEKNGLIRSKVLVSLNTSKNTVKVDYSQHFQPLFLHIFGVDSLEIRATATAKATQKPSVFEYVLFLGDRSKNFNIHGNNHVVDGPVHINGDMHLLGNNNTFNDRLEIVGSLVGLGLHNVYKQLIRPSPYKEMPVFDINDYREKATKIYNSSTIFFSNLLELDGVVFVDGNVTILGNKFKGNGTIVATGSIFISGNQLEYSSKEDLIGLYSLKNIVFSNNSATFEGCFYAPNGSIIFYGNRATVIGAVIASDINITGNGYHFMYDPRVSQIESEKNIRLVE